MNRISPLWELNSEEAHVSHILSLSLWVNCLSHFTKLVDACVTYIVPNIFKNTIYKKHVKGILINVQVSVQDWNVVVYRRKIFKAFNIRRWTETETETERAI